MWTSFSRMTRHFQSQSERLCEEDTMCVLPLISRERSYFGSQFDRLTCYLFIQNFSYLGANLFLNHTGNFRCQQWLQRNLPLPDAWAVKWMQILSVRLFGGCEYLRSWVFTASQNDLGKLEWFRMTPPDHKWNIYNIVILLRFISGWCHHCRLPNQNHRWLNGS